MRDIEAAVTDEAGGCVLSRTAAGAVCERLWSEYQAFAQRDLSEIHIVYLFLDGVAERLHLGAPREAVLAAWGIDSNDAKHLLALLPGLKEGADACIEFLRDLTARHLRNPGLVITDGAPGLIAAVLLERMFGEERRRTKVIPHAFGERAVMKQMCAALMRARQGWRKVIVTPFEIEQIQTLHGHLRNEFEQRHASPLNSASRSQVHCTQGT